MKQRIYGFLWVLLISIVIVLYISIEAGASDLFINIQLPENQTNIQINNTGVNGESCLFGNGILKKGEMTLDNFNKIAVSGIFNIKIRQQNSRRFEISCDANLFSKIRASVSNGLLKIDTSQSLCPKLPIDINVGVTELRELHSAGADDISVLYLDNKAFFLKSDGSGDIRISGKTEKFHAELSGAGDLDASEFIADTVFVQSMGAGDARVHAKRKIKAQIEGAGDITYLGTPGQVVYNGDGVGELDADE